MNLEDRLTKDGAQEYVTFYGARNPNGKGSNFSFDGVWLPTPFSAGEPVWHPTGEHRYQAMKAKHEREYEYVRAASGPGVAKDRGRLVELRDGWGANYGHLCWYVMLETIFAKTRQNSSVAFWLRGTGNAHIYEDSPTDDIWGWRFQNDYRGRNLLGLCWMEVRKTLYDL